VNTPQSVSQAQMRRRPTGEPPPLPRSIDMRTRVWVFVSTILVLLWGLALSTGGMPSWLVRGETAAVEWIAEHRTARCTSFLQPLQKFFAGYGPPLIGWPVVLTLLFFKRFRQILVYVGVLASLVAIVVFVQDAMVRPRPYGVENLGRWEDFSHPSRAVALVAGALFGGVLLLLPTGKTLERGRIAAGVLVAVLAVSTVYLGTAYPLDVLAGAILGVALPNFVCAWLVPREAFPVTWHRGETAHLDVGGARGEAIRQAVAEQLGFTVLDFVPILEQSAGSTPLKITILDQEGEKTRVFAKLLSTSHLQSDRSYKLVRTLLHGRFEDERGFASVRRLVEHEDYMSRVMSGIGVPVPRSYGVVQITPAREYLMVTEFLWGASVITEAEVTGEVLDHALQLVRKMWDSGVAHRDFHMGNVMVRKGEVFLIDMSFAEMRPSAWRQAVDLGNMMLILALRRDAPTVYEHALKYFAPEDIAEAFAAMRGLTIPRRLREKLRLDGRDLVAEFRGLAPPRARIRIQRWTWRRLALIVVVVSAAILSTSLIIGYFRVADLLP